MSSLRVAMLIRLAMFCPRQSIRRVTNYVRQQHRSGSKTHESMRPARRIVAVQALEDEIFTDEINTPITSSIR
jgi:hypothetical protein